jgi:hypothetical protein
MQREHDTDNTVLGSRLFKSNLHVDHAEIMHSNSEFREKRQKLSHVRGQSEDSKGCHCLKARSIDNPTSSQTLQLGIFRLNVSQAFRFSG